MTKDHHTEINNPNRQNKLIDKHPVAHFLLLCNIGLAKSPRISERVDSALGMRLAIFSKKDCHLCLSEAHLL